MTIIEFILRASNKIPIARKCIRWLIWKAVIDDGRRRKLNDFYLKLSYRERKFFHYYFSQLFRHKDGSKVNGFWNIKFLSSEIEIPLEGKTIWLNWDSAVSIIGHDIEIKSFYERIINSDYRPKCFLDIGANYGTHSLLFLSQGIPSISFEPNKNCRFFFDRLLEVNNLEGRFENIALGEGNTSAELSFPARDTWYGSLSEKHQRAFADEPNIEKTTVEVHSLDFYVKSKDIKPGLIKIDVEGYEGKVLRGAVSTLKKYKSIVIFESNYPEDRKMLWGIFKEINYVVFELELNRAHRIRRIKEKTFYTVVSNNFLAIHDGHPLVSEL